MNEFISQLAGKVVGGVNLDKEEILELCKQSEDDLWDLLYWANKIRQENFGDKIKVCSIVPGRLGGCDQDCKFCAQSVRYNTSVDKKASLLSDEEILRAAKQAKSDGVGNFGIVYSGKAVTDSEFERLEKLIREIKSEIGVSVCASLGIVDSDRARRLADAGVERYNHNLETSERFFPNIVSTHKYAERTATIKAVEAVGMGVCSGGIFGIGESDEDRVDMALKLRELGVDMVPMNFLHPIEGTPLGEMETLKPLEILRIVAIYRFILPKVHLKVAGGRVLNLRDMQSWMFYAGATSILSGNYLTTAGRAVEEDMQMLRDLGLRVDG